MKWNTIPISTPVSNPISENLAMKEIIEYYGKRFKDAHTGIRWKIRSDFSAGLEFINMKCDKHHKSAIRNIIYSNEKKPHEGREVRIWYFHRKKVIRFLRILHQVMEGNETPDEYIKQKFDELYTRLTKNYYLQKSGGDIISAPYKSELNAATVSNEYTDKDKGFINQITIELKTFDTLYRGENDE